MISVLEATTIIRREMPRTKVETVDLSMGVGRVLAEDIIADMDMPPFNRSQMDGFAVRAKDTAGSPVELTIVGESSAGRGWHHELGAGEAVRIMTGAPVPAGADAVQKVELTRESDNVVEILGPVESGKNIVACGSETRSGETVVNQGSRINANMIATLAAFGYSKAKVAVRPTVSILSTGSEIVEIGKTPGADQIRNSNSAMLRALSEACGGAAEILAVVSDDIGLLRSSIAAAVSRSDILLITGGVSVGKYDLTKLALSEIGAEIFFERVSMKPGKPTVFAKMGRTSIFGLPGNPVSAAVSFYLFARPAILHMQCALETGLTERFAVITTAARSPKERDAYIPATLGTDVFGRLTATPSRWQGSSDFIGFADAEALIHVPKGHRVNSDDVVKVFVF